MKPVKLMLLSLALALLVSCGKTRPSTMKVQGPLTDYFEVVDKEYALNDGKLIVEINRTKDGMPTGYTDGMKFGKEDGECEMQFTIEYLDRDGNVIEKSESKNESELQSLINLKNGETGSITFQCDNAKTEKFRISSNFEAHTVKTTATTTSISATAGTKTSKNTVTLTGYIGEYSTKMTLNISSTGSVSCSYYYYNQLNSKTLYLSGTLNGTYLRMTRSNAQGNYVFEGTYDGSTLSGSFDTPYNYYTCNFNRI